MNTVTRRTFFRALLLIPLGLWLVKPVRRLLGPSVNSIQVQSVSTFSAPFLLAQLSPGKSLDILWKKDRAYLRLGEYIVGRMPALLEHALKGWPQAWEALEVQVRKVNRNQQGRLQLSILLKSKIL